MPDGPSINSAPGPDAIIRAVGLGRRFVTPGRVVDAIADLTLDVRDGEMCMIVGPSGCGKSTFLRILAGLETATSGSLRIQRADGTVPSNAVVFQGRSLFPWLSVSRNVSYGLALRGVNRDDQRSRVDDLLGVLGLTSFADAYPHQISEGMRQRVAIGRALAVNPDLLLMDEPFGALDEQTRYLLQEELLRIWERTRKTVVFVTHSIDEAITLGDRVVVMSAQPGHVREILDVPFSRPRQLRDIRAEVAFGDLFRTIWDALKDEVTRSRLSQEPQVTR